jgi:cell wall-associated NlpC family hydrolase
MRHAFVLAVGLLAALSAACASSGAVPRPFPTPGGTARADAPAAPGATVPLAATAPPPPAYAQALVDSALRLVGAKYKNGGTDPNGFDCSGFTQYVFAQYGLALPRAVRDQFNVGASIDPSGDLAAGDLLFFTTTEPGASHVAIAIGNDEFVHAPSSTGVVRVEKLTVRYWAERFLGARRVTQP